MTQISQMDADEKGESKPILRSFICVNLRHLRNLRSLLPAEMRHPYASHSAKAN